MRRSLASDGGWRRNPIGGRRKRILEQLRRNLQNHPATTAVRFVESGTGTDWRLAADLDLSILVRGDPPADEAQLYVNWWTHPDPTPDQFKIHYSDSSGFDCGWHRQENEHVDGLDHYQERPSSDADYAHDPVSFGHENPVGILWETLDGRLKPRLDQRAESFSR